MPQKSIKVTKRTPIKCCMCDTAAEYWVSYSDPDQPGPEHWFDHSRQVYREPTLLKKSCKVHLTEVNYAVLVEAGLAPKLQVPEVGDIQGPSVGGDIPYVGTTDEPKTQS